MYTLYVLKKYVYQKQHRYLGSLQALCAKISFGELMNLHRQCMKECEWMNVTHLVKKRFVLS